MNKLLEAVNLQKTYSSGEVQTHALRGIEFTFFIIFITFFVLSSSKAPVGSSAITISACFIKVLAIATRCCCPPDNSS